MDIDHILPYSRTLDDSQGNKVVCFRRENDAKGQRSPFEWLAAADPERYEKVCQQARVLRYGKYRKFLQKELELDDFIERQLRDTAYIASLVVAYLKMLVPNEHDVLGLKGAHTAELRHQWGLDKILAEMPDSPAWQENGEKLRPGEKNRADHRHHAIDAIIVALTDRSRLQHLSRIQKDGGMRVTGEVLPEPWKNFRDSVVAHVKGIKVSHRVSRQVAGKLHEETAYGPVRDNAGDVVQGKFVVRKPVESLSPNEVELIRDPTIRKIVADAVAGAGVKSGRRKKGAEKEADAGQKLKAALANLKMPSGVPIKRVRIVKPELTIQPIRQRKAQAAGDPTQITYVKPGGTHHLCLWEWEENGKRVRGMKCITRLEAAQRVRDEEAVIQRTHPERSDARFVMSLSAGELVLFKWKGEERLLTFRTAASTQGQMYFAMHTDARRSAEYRKFVCNCNTLDARKVTVDPLGRIRWAND